MSATNFKIDRRSAVTQVRDGLRRLIMAGGLEPGDQLPSETEIATRFGVARGTVREALKLLEQGGLVEVQQGRGRFLSALANGMVTRPITEFESATEMLRGLGYELRNRVLSVEQRDATEQQAAALGLSTPSRVVCLRRLRLHRGQALIYEINVFPSEFLAGRSVRKADFTGSLNVWLEKLGHGAVSSLASIQATKVPNEIASMPEVDADTPWLLITERCLDRQGLPVVFSQDFHRGDTFSFQVFRQRTN